LEEKGEVKLPSSKQSTNQPISQTSNQAINQTTNQPISQRPTEQSSS